MTPASRGALVTRLRDRFEWDGCPRLTVTVIVAFAGLAAFLTSVLGLRIGLQEMGVRYGLATLAGYVAFILLIRVWIALQRGWVPDIEPDVVPDVVDLALDVPHFHVGRLGGGGHDVPSNVGHLDGTEIEAASPVGDWFSFDADELLLVVLALLLVLGGGLALAYVISSAPVLLAEVALDAALVSSISRHLRREEAGWWCGAVVRRTVVPALALTLFVTGAGMALQHLAPDAHSIGAVIRTITS